MSYEGYIEYLCPDGHYSILDAHWNYGGGASKEERAQAMTCRVCGKTFNRYHHVDETNGYDTSHPDTCDAQKKEIGFTDVWNTDHYGTKYAVKVLRYEPGLEWVSTD